MRDIFIAVVAFAAGVALRDQTEEWKPAAPAAEPPIQLSHPIPYDAAVCQDRCRFYVRTSKEEQ